MKDRKKHANMWGRKTVFSHILLFCDHFVRVSVKHITCQICSAVTKTSYFRHHNWHIKSLPKQRRIPNNVTLFCFCHVCVQRWDACNSLYSKVIVHNKMLRDSATLLVFFKTATIPILSLHPETLQGTLFCRELKVCRVSKSEKLTLLQLLAAVLIWFTEGVNLEQVNVATDTFSRQLMHRVLGSYMTLFVLACGTYFIKQRRSPFCSSVKKKQTKKH